MFLYFSSVFEPGESSSCDHHSHLSGDWPVSACERELFGCDDPQRAHVLQRSRSDLGVRPHDTPILYIHIQIHRSCWSTVLLTGMSHIYNTRNFC